eukprot:jgi/Psemu1/45103/gm1.45103_g
MGNAAAKQLDETELGVGSLHKDDDNVDKSIVKAFISTKEGVTKIKNKGKTWVHCCEDNNNTHNNDGTTTTTQQQQLLWKSVSVGTIHSHSVIFDSSETPVAIIITEKMGMASATNFVCRPVPSFEGQSPLTEEERKKAGIGPATTTALYKFAKFVTSRKLTTAKCAYGIVTGNEDEDILNLYEGEKLSSLGFKAIFKEVSSSAEDGNDNGGVVVAKAFTQGMSMSPTVDVAIGVDMLAIVSIGYSLAGDPSSAGALAGAGVV